MIKNQFPQPQRRGHAPKLSRKPSRVAETWIAVKELQVKSDFVIPYVKMVIIVSKKLAIFINQKKKKWFCNNPINKSNK